MLMVIKSDVLEHLKSFVAKEHLFILKYSFQTPRVLPEYSSWPKHISIKKPRSHLK